MGMHGKLVLRMARPDYNGFRGDKFGTFHRALACGGMKTDARFVVGNPLARRQSVS